MVRSLDGLGGGDQGDGTGLPSSVAVPSHVSSQASKFWGKGSDSEEESSEEEETTSSEEESSSEGESSDSSSSSGSSDDSSKPKKGGASRCGV